MRNIVLSLFAITILTLSGMAYSAAIPAVTTNSFGNSKVLFWETVTNADTVTSAAWPGGKGYVQITGTTDSAVLELLFGTDGVGSEISIDSDATPDGFTFTNTTGGTLFNFPRGSIDFSISGGGGSQDIDIKISPVRQ